MKPLFAGTTAGYPLRANARVGLLAATLLALASLVALILGRPQGVGPLGPAPADEAPAALSTESEALAAYGKLPMSFIRNVGQADPEVRYYASGPGFGFYFTKERAVFGFESGERKAAISLRFPGASPQTTVAAEAKLPGVVNYLVGERENWRTGVPTYAAVVYRDLWPGIDMAVRGRSGALKYEFRLAPGARVDNVRLAYGGVNGLSLSGGALLLDTPLGVLRDRPPVSYQRIGGEKVAVESRYVIRNGEVGFAVGPYDARHPLVIDPELVYSTYLGGRGQDFSLAGIAVDNRGNAYIAGRTLSPDFPTTPQAFQRMDTDPGSDGFVTKLNKDGTAPIYSTYLGGRGTVDDIWDIVVDEKEHAYVGGVTNSTDFPTTPGVIQPADPDPATLDGFITKLDETGSAPIFSTYFGGHGPDDEAVSLDVDRQERVYVSGETTSADLPVTPNAFDPTYNGGYDSFAAKMNETATVLIFSTYLGGSDGDATQHAMSVDPEGNAYVAGGTSSIDYPTTPGAFQEVDPDPTGDDGFVTKLDGTGAVIYSTYLGGAGSRRSAPTALPIIERVLALDVDENGRAYVSGRTDSASFPTTPDAFDPTYNGAFDAFATVVEKDGSALVGSTYLGGPANDTAFSVRIDRGHAYVAGVTASQNYPTTERAFQPADPDPAGQDAFLTELKRDISALLYSTYLGGRGFDQGFGVDVRDDGAVFVTGWTDALDFPTTPGSFQPADPHPVPGAAGRDVFVTKLHTEPSSPTNPTTGPHEELLELITGKE